MMRIFGFKTEGVGGGCEPLTEELHKLYPTTNIIMTTNSRVMGCTYNIRGEV
jgi:hypothetical protein